LSPFSWNWYHWHEVLFCYSIFESILMKLISLTWSLVLLLSLVKCLEEKQSSIYKKRKMTKCINNHHTIEKIYSTTIKWSNSSSILSLMLFYLECRKQFVLNYCLQIYFFFFCAKAIIAFKITLSTVWWYINNRIK
jgi:hypothetical protein